MKEQSLSRREVINRIGWAVGGLIYSPALIAILESCKEPEIITSKYHLSAIQEKMLFEIAERIIPETDTPGAIAAKVPQFIFMTFKEVFDEKNQENFIAGINEIAELAKQKYGLPFLQCTESQQTEILLNIEKKSNDFFKLLKDLTLTGYFTSKIGATQALNYVHIPGRYDGNTTLEKGQKAWA
ncbi:MAG: gluconate 2-dehydrogenase subunit 3 family protein [Bacteroidota bacterium]|nr:gluconate 2-dehydrogenase subunit 3 family protein [Bacteroidota bacterium]